MTETRREMRELTERFPAFEFRLIRGCYGRRWFEAVRRSGPGPAGLYVAISGDAAELAAELKDTA